jgi:hypothetical protein
MVSTLALVSAFLLFFAPTLAVFIWGLSRLAE